jgi:deoxycytidine triphosphate deaminase
MLSDKEIWQELGKGIVICPFKPNNKNEAKFKEKWRSNIDGASIYVTASNVGWHFAKSDLERAGEKLSLMDAPDKAGKKQLIIPPNEWAVLCTEEIIYLKKWISGVCHAKVSMALKGLGHIAAPLKPGCGTRLLLVFFNHTSKDFPIDVGSQIAVVTFYRLDVEPSVEVDSETDRKNLMKEMGFDIRVLESKLDNAPSYLSEYSWDEAKKRMEADIKEHIKQIKDNKEEYGYTYYIPENTRKPFNWRRLLIAIIVLCALCGVGLFGFSFNKGVGANAEWMRNVGSLLFGGIIMGVVGVILNSNISLNKNEK